MAIGDARVHDMVSAHRGFGAPEMLIAKRRAFYALAARFIDKDAGGSLLQLPFMLDSPSVRHAIGLAARTQEGLLGESIVPLSALSRSEWEICVGNLTLSLASTDTAGRLLGGSLGLLESGLPDNSVRLICDSDRDKFPIARERLTLGLSLAAAVAPQLLEDLFPHISLVGLFTSANAQIASGSLREWPGLVLVNYTESPDLMAEMFIHEGAHQKFFDICIAHDILRAETSQADYYSVPWLNEEIAWPVSQVLAAAHAYGCLAEFGDALPSKSPRRPKESLLPFAEQRYTLLRSWLFEHQELLGIDALNLLDEPRCSSASDIPASDLGRVEAERIGTDPAVEFCDGGGWDRVLVGKDVQPPQFYWLDRDAAVILRLLLTGGVDDAVSSYAHLTGLSGDEARREVERRLPELKQRSLVSVTF